MKSLRGEIFVPTALLAVVVGATLTFLAWDTARQAREVERDANHVRQATALALALTDAAQDEERAMSAVALRPEGFQPSTLAATRERVGALLTRVRDLPMPPRPAEVRRRFVEARAALSPIGDEVVDAAIRGRETGVAIDKWLLMNDRADRLLRDLTAYHLNRLDRTVADLQRRRARALALAGAAVVLGLLLAAAFAVVVARTVVRPIAEMAAVARRIQQTGTASRVSGSEREDEIGVLARAFNDMTERLTSTNATLADAVRVRDEFISVASHELKTPITPLVLRVQQLLKVAREGEGDAIARDRVLQSTRNLDGHVAKLKKLVDNLLDVSRINSGQLALALEEFDVRGAVKDALDRVAPELAAAGCHLRVEAEPELVVRADRLRVEQVLVNLLGNAAKYAPGCPVVVRARAEGAFVDLEVEDGGPGIPPEARERVFRRFERAVVDRHVSGLGLGLYIGREIARAHGGDLTLRSAPGRGATFVLRILREPARDEASRRPERGADAAAEAPPAANAAEGGSTDPGAP